MRLLWFEEAEVRLRPSDHEKHRILGQQLLGLTLQFVSAEEHDKNGPILLEQARTVGHAYGEISKLGHMSLTDALQATLFFRDRLVEVALQLP